MSFFSDAKGFTINDGAFNLVQGNQFNNTYNLADPNDVFKLVATNAAANGLYNSEQRFPLPNCHPDTRTEILQECNQWVLAKSASERVYWIHGPAGVGKSAIMQNMSERHARQSPELPHPRLAASFFFSRNDVTRDKLDPFVATVVYQFLKCEPLRAALGESIFEAVRADPHIFRTTFENQVQKLILEPCTKVDPKEWDLLPNLVAIDGLDECILVPSQERLITIIRKAIPKCPLIFLVASRPEPRIRRAFEHEGFTSFLGRLPVGKSDESTRDITIYFHERFGQLQDTHPELRPLDVSWPGEEKIRELVRRAGGQFIFAVTVMKYLESDDSLPSERLKAILSTKVEDSTESPYADLDLLYRQILSTCPVVNREKSSMILCLLATPHFHPPRLDGQGKVTDRFIFVRQNGSWRSSGMIEALLNLKRGEVETLLFRLHSVIEVPSDAYGKNVRIVHASFTEYISDPNRSGDYHVKKLEKLDYLDLIARALLRIISGHSRNYRSYLSSSATRPPPYNSPTLMNTRYSIINVLHICLKLDTPSDELLKALNQFDPYLFGTWVMNSGLYRSSYLQRWREFIKWAESFEPRGSQTFLGKIESFMDGFCIASPPKSTTLQHLDCVRAYLEHVLYATNPVHLKWHELLQSLYNVVIEVNLRVLLLPADSRQSPQLRDWVLLTVTRKDAENVDGLLGSLANCSSEENLIQDIRDDTYESVHTLDLVKQNNLYSLRKLVVQRQKEIGVTPFPCTPPSTAQMGSEEMASNLPTVNQEANPINEDDNLVNEGTELLEMEARSVGNAGFHSIATAVANPNPKVHIHRVLMVGIWVLPILLALMLYYNTPSLYG
ncbi:hypothetical protein VNI00_013581 [Paramarasmius palmivorus]|uniref:NACHT domain-containing protein n=1 Tax=Paramarasmius palmivorus TaxID=297713 RepID=A0AAW0BWJ9_9AGAR